MSLESVLDTWKRSERHTRNANTATTISADGERGGDGDGKDPAKVAVCKHRKVESEPFGLVGCAGSR